MSDKINEQVVLNLLQQNIIKKLTEQSVVDIDATNKFTIVKPGTKVDPNPPIGLKVQRYGAIDLEKTSYEGESITLSNIIENDIKITLNDNFVLSRIGSTDDLETSAPTKNVNSLEPLLTINTKIFAALTPIIKIYRIDKTGNVEAGKEEKTRLYVFDDKPKNIFQGFSTPSSIESNQYYETNIKNTGSGLGAGIKNLSFTLAGTNPVESTRAVNVTLELLFQSIDDFLGYTDPQISEIKNTFDATDTEDPDGTSTEKITKTRNYLSLITRSNPQAKFSNSITDFKIKLQIYWGFDENVLKELGATEELISLIKSIKLELVLSLITHSLEFSENGNINLKIDYFGGVEKALTSNQARIFKAFKQHVKKEITKKDSTDANSSTQYFKDIAVYYDKFKKNCSEIVKGNLTEEDQKVLDQINTTYTEPKIAEIKKTLSSISDTNSELDNKFDNAVYEAFSALLIRCSIEITPEEQTKIVNYLEGTDRGREPSLSKDTKQYSGGDIDLKEAEEEKVFQSEAGNTTDIFFYTFGNIIKTFLRLAIQNEEIKINFGTVSGYINIADICISSNLFQSWFSNYITSKNIDLITLQDLIKNSITGLLSPAFQTEYVKEESLDNGASSGTKQSTKIDFTYLIDPINNEINIISTERTDKICGESYTLPNSVSDSKRKILHLFVGNNFGIAKSIKFKRIDVPYAREAKATSNGFIPLNTLRDVYNADVEMVGNMLFYPGDIVYIRPNYKLGDPSIRNSLANIMGLGGYYSITKVSSTIQNSVWNTTMECYWQKSGDALECDKDESKLNTCQSLIVELNDKRLKDTIEKVQVPAPQ